MGAACCTEDKSGAPAGTLEVATVQPAFSTPTSVEEKAPPPAQNQDEPPAANDGETGAEEALKSNGMVLGFLLPDGTTKDILFTHGPVGLDFEKKMPIMIKRLRHDGPGMQLGIGINWQIISVDRTDIREMDFASAFTMLKKASGGLPTKP